uniref:Uncharacterized protein n=1 Tax=Anguilla anguilla TaxID=7936 RepID=A0A0E9TCE6_ANGAN
MASFTFEEINCNTVIKAPPCVVYFTVLKIKDYHALRMPK